MALANPPTVIGIVAGETSGDRLGGPLMASIKERLPQVSFVGIGGERMLEEGLDSVASIDELSINGFVEPLKRLPSLWKLLRKLSARLASADAVVGVDFNVFNLLMERRLKRRGVPTAHYVSPSVYAWRQGRVHSIGRSTDVVMALFPFETELYRQANVRAEFVGHPMADEIDPDESIGSRRTEARRQLGLDDGTHVIAVLPGSRLSEVKLMGQLFLEAIDHYRNSQLRDDVVVLVPCVHEGLAEVVRQMADRMFALRVVTLDGQARLALAAADGALIKSGTGTLEGMLLGVPMVVSYRLGRLSYEVVRRRLKTKWVALPNILSQRELVPELLQDAATPHSLASSLHESMRRHADDPQTLVTYRQLHRELRQSASDRAAEIVLSLLKTKAD